MIRPYTAVPESGELLIVEQTREYELVMVLSPEATEEEINSTVERVSGIVTTSKGSLGSHEIWGLRKLAYPVNNHREGNYVLTRFSLDPEAVQEFGRTLNASEEIIRFLVTKVEPQASPES